ncbi:MAG: WD40 repeat domain-containing protein [Gemmataceae bacterium]|nr:WD40 repeat domain-containing protein [Gemmataceae bacterium]
MRRNFAGLLSGFTIAAVLGILSGAAQEKSATQIVATFKGHTEPVYSVAFTPDGKYLATGSFDHTIKLWEVATSKEAKTYGGPTGHQKMVMCVTISPDGQLLASGSIDNTLKVWDVPLTAPSRLLPATEAVNGVAQSPDGTKLAFGSKDGQVKLVNVADAKELFKLEGHAGPVTGVAFSPNGQTLASSGADKTLRFWNVANGQLLGVVTAHSAAANAVAFSTNSVQAMSAGDDGYLRVWQMPPTPSKPIAVTQPAPITTAILTPDNNSILAGGEDKVVRQTQIAGKEVRALTGPTAAVTAVTISPNNAFLAAGAADQRVWLWNNGNNQPLGSVLAHAGAVTAAQFHPNSTQLLTAGGDGMVKVWTMPHVAAKAIAHPDAVVVALPAPDGKKLFTGGADKIVRVWNPANLQMERQFVGHAAPITALAVNANGQVLVSGSGDASIRLWNQQTGKEANILTGHAAAITSLNLNPAGTQLLSTSEDGSVKVWQLPIVEPKPFVHPDQVTSLAVSADAARMVTGGQDKVVRLWNLANGAAERAYAGPTLAVTAVAISNDNRFVAAGSADKTLHLWGFGDAKVLQKLTFPNVVHSVAFTPDGQFVIAGLADGVIKVHKTVDGKEDKTFAGHKGAVAGLAIAPKGDVLISASGDKTIQLWTIADAKSKTTLTHAGPITSFAMSKDGTRVAAGSDKTIKVWTLADGKEIAAIASPAEVKGLGLLADGTRLVVAGGDKLTRIVELDGKLVEMFGHDAAVHAAAFLDAKRVVSAGADKLARLWTSSLVWQKAHQGPVRQAVFTPKGEVLSCGDDKSIRWWNAADGKDIKTLAAHDAAVLGVSLSADATKLASFGADKQIKLWNPAAAKPEDAAKPATVIPVAAPGAIALSPNGLRLAVADAAQVRILDAATGPATGKEIQQLAEHAAPVKALAFLPDSRTLFTGAADKTAKLLDVNIAAAFDAHPGGVVAAQYHANGAQALTAGADKTVKLWDLTKNAVIKTFGPLPEPIKFASFNRDYTQAGVAAGKTVKIWNLADGKDIANLPHPAEVKSLSFTADKTRVATGAADKLTRLWDLATAKELQFFPQDDVVAAVLFTPQNALVSAAGKTARLDTPNAVRAIQADAGPVHGLAVVPNGAHVLTGGADKVMKMWNLGNGQLDRSFAGATDVIRAVAVNKNTQLVAAGGADQTVRVFNFADGKEIDKVKVDGAVQALQFTPNNVILLAACADKSLRAWSVPFNPGQEPSPEFLKSIQNFTTADMVHDLALANDNAVFYAAGADKKVHVWKLASTSPIQNYPHPNIVDCVAFDAKSTILVSGCHDGKIRIFDLVKKALAKEITAHVQTKPNNVAHPVYTVAFSADGKQLLSSSFDKTMKLWDVASGNLVREFKAFHEKDFPKGHQEEVFTAAFSPDGKFVASGSGGLERVIKIWNVADGSVVRDLANPQIKSDPKTPMSHPGWIYHLRFTKDGKLISAGDAPKNQGYLAVWNPQDGKLLYADTQPIGSFFNLALPPDEKLIAIAAGSRGRPAPEFNNAYLVRIPVLGK